MNYEPFLQEKETAHDNKTQIQRFLVFGSKLILYYLVNKYGRHS
jgi:hypothetical protein